MTNYHEPPLTVQHRVPGTDASSIVQCSHDHCLTCGDVAIPGLVQSIDVETFIAVIEIAGAMTEVDVTLLDNVECGNTVLVHAGTAIARLDDHER